MESPAEAQSSLLPELAPSLSTPCRQEHFSTEPQLPQGHATYLDEIHDHLPPYAAWYSEYDNSQPRSEVTPPLVKIPYKIMLDVPLEALGLPMAEYRSKQCHGGRIRATVFFHTPGSYHGNDSNRMAIPGIQSVNYAMSEDTAAMEAMGYIKHMVTTEIRDYNYSGMKKLKEENKSLKHQLAITKKKKERMEMKIKSMKNNLKMARYKNKNNAMGWFVLTRYMHGLSNHICNVIALNKSAGKEPIDQLINVPLINIEKVAERLKRRVISSEKKFRSIRRGF